MMALALAVVLASGVTPPLPATKPPPAPVAETIRWRPSYEAALAEAKKQGQPVLLDFYADWCGWCRVMEREVYTDPRVVQLASGAICVKIDVDRDLKNTTLYQVSSLPRTIVLTPAGEIAADLAGYVEADKFVDYFQGALKAVHEPVLRQQRAAALDSRDPVALVKLLGDKDPATRAAAGPALKELGAAAWPALVDALASEYLGTRIAAHAVLRQTVKDPPAFDPWADKVARAQAVARWRKLTGSPTDAP